MRVIPYDLTTAGIIVFRLVCYVPHIGPICIRPIVIRPIVNRPIVIKPIGIGPNVMSYGRTQGKVLVFIFCILFGKFTAF